MSIVEFLRARYEEAREREHGKRRGIPSPFDSHDVEVRYSADEGQQVIVDGHPYPAEQYFEIATEPAPDPDVLADLDAKLAILDEYDRCKGDADGATPNEHTGWADALDWVMATLAVPFAAHPDYDERWRP